MRLICGNVAYERTRHTNWISHQYVWQRSFIPLPWNAPSYGMPRKMKNFATYFFESSSKLSCNDFAQKFPIHVENMKRYCVHRAQRCTSLFVVQRGNAASYCIARQPARNCANTLFTMVTIRSGACVHKSFHLLARWPPVPYGNVRVVPNDTIRCTVASNRNARLISF